MNRNHPIAVSFVSFAGPSPTLLVVVIFTFTDAIMEQSHLLHQRLRIILGRLLLSVGDMLLWRTGRERSTTASCRTHS